MDILVSQLVFLLATLLPIQCSNLDSLDFLGSRTPLPTSRGSHKPLRRLQEPLLLPPRLLPDPPPFPATGCRGRSSVAGGLTPVRSLWDTFAPIPPPFKLQPAPVL